MGTVVTPWQFDDPRDAAQFRRIHRPGVELYRAHIVRHAFDAHSHDGFGLGAIESGVERFRYRGGDHLAPPQSLVLMNPDMLHTGRAETDEGWRYRMIYIEPAALAEVVGERGWWFTDPVGHDRAAARRVGALLAAMWASDEPLALDSALFELLEAIRPHARGTRPAPVASRAADGALERALALMHAQLHATLTLEDLSGAAALSPFHFLRRFKDRHHVTPHQMLMALRLALAKRKLASGESPAEVAIAVGLVDQAHLTRRFARMYGVTPARYQQQLGTRPARRA